MPAPIVNTFFRSLTERFPTWMELKAHLESADGGALRVIQTVESPYAVIRYVKGKSLMGDAALGVGQFRSVVWNTDTNLPVCVAPAKATEGVPPTGVQLATVEDFVDGTMVNVFVVGDGSLTIATRTTVGGANTFYGDKTFGEMFMDGLRASPMRTLEGLEQALKSAGAEATVAGTGAAAAAVFASFVVQHPAHRVVQRVKVPTVYCIHVGRVAEDGEVTLMESPSTWPKALGRLQVASYPLRMFRTEAEVTDLLRKTAVQRGWTWQGLVFKDGHGGRWRLRSDTYQMLRELRGSEANPVDRFLRLRSEGKVMEYLKHYGEDREAFWKMEETLRERTKDVLVAYSDCHKAHAVPFKELPEAYRTAVFQLHVMWRDELRAKGFKVRLQNAIKVVNAMRDFERRRLLEAAPYVAVAPSPAPANTPTEDVEEGDESEEGEVAVSPTQEEQTEAE